MFVQCFLTLAYVFVHERNLRTLQLSTPTCIGSTSTDTRLWNGNMQTNAGLISGTQRTHNNINSKVGKASLHADVGSLHVLGHSKN